MFSIFLRVGLGLVLLFLVSCTSATTTGPDAEPDPQVGISISPRTIELATGTTQQFTATLTGLSSVEELSWEATGGTITGSGNSVLFTAPPTAGSYELSVTASPSGTEDTANIDVISPFVLRVLDPGDNRDHSSDVGVRFVERDGRSGFLVVELRSTITEAQTIDISIASSAPSGITFGWDVQDVFLHPGAHNIVSLPISASADAPLGEHVMRINATAGEAVRTAEATFVVVEPPTSVGGIIDSDTTWTVENSPYRISSQVQVDLDVTLTIEPGVVVSDGSIRVWGSLQVLGSPENPVVIRATEISGSASSSDYGPYAMDFQHVEFFDVRFVPSSGGSDSGVFSLRDSIIHSGFDDVWMWHPTGEVFIERNVFETAVSFRAYHRQSVYFVDNTFEAGGRIESDFASSPPIVVRSNNFLDASFRVALGNGGGGALDARENYWGTTDRSVIESMIIDRNDGLEYGTIIQFEPYLLAPTSR